jgi:GTP:adenosylcobinamide-phosphate guanylyltransferase
MSAADLPTGSLGAIVLANGHADKLATKLGVPHKALLDMGGVPMVLRVREALEASPLVGRTVIACLKGGPVAEALRGQTELAEAEGESFLNGIEQGFAAMPEADRAILATCDMPLLSPAAVTELAGQVLKPPAVDLVYAIVEIELERRAYPETHRTSVKLREGSYTAAGLCAVSRRFVETCGPILMAAFGARKSKVAMGRLLGWGFLARFALGTLSLGDIAKRAEELLDCKCRVVDLPYPESGFDVDSLTDLESARRVFERLKGS